MNSQQARDLRDRHEIGLAQIKQAINLAAMDPLYRGDIELAIEAIKAAGLAIDVKGGPDVRAMWNYRRAMNRLGRQFS
jgi:translation elongation factor EF-Ts